MQSVGSPFGANFKPVLPLFCTFKIKQAVHFLSRATPAVQAWVSTAAWHSLYPAMPLRSREAKRLNLDQQSVFACTDNSFDLQVLFQGLEEYLYLQPVLVNDRYGDDSKVEMVHKKNYLILFFLPQTIILLRGQDISD